jgi:anion-transporting  ArsA/GET3 family ATPase
VSLEEFLSIKKTLLCVGSGGVGKTTTSAAIAAHLARMGRRVMVCTIDPARRLASSLGLSIKGNEETLVANYGRGALWAIMLDVKATFDDIVTRNAPSEAARQAIFNNRYYQHVSGALSVSQEFMAMEKLHELSSCGRYDVVVLDTPPTTNTLDFLKTPELIVAAMDDRFMRWLLAPYLAMKERRGFGLAAFAAEKIFNTLGSVLGLEALRDVSEFVDLMQDLTAGFKLRAGKVKSLISDMSTGFIIVATAREQSVHEAAYFYKELEAINGDVIAVILNRMRWPEAPPSEARLQELLSQLSPETASALGSDLRRLCDEGHAEQRCASQLAGKVPASLIQKVLQLDHDIHDLRGLEFYSEMLR